MRLLDNSINLCRPQKRQKLDNFSTITECVLDQCVLLIKNKLQFLYLQREKHTEQSKTLDAWQPVWCPRMQPSVSSIQVKRRYLPINMQQNSSFIWSDRSITVIYSPWLFRMIVYSPWCIIPCFFFIGNGNRQCFICPGKSHQVCRDYSVRAADVAFSVTEFTAGLTKTKQSSQIICLP